MSSGRSFRVAVVVFISAAVLGVVSLAQRVLTEERWIAEFNPGFNPAMTGSPPSVLVTYEEGFDKGVLAVRMNYVHWANERDIQLTIHCGSERLLAGAGEVAPVPPGLQPAAYFPDACVEEPKVLTAPGMVWLLFPRPKSMGSSFVLVLPRVSCYGRQCASLMVPATVGFVRQRVPRGLTVH